MSILLLTRSPAVLDAVARLAAAAGHDPTVRDEPAAALTEWAEAAVVLVGTDLVEAVATLAPARRSGVHVVGDAPPDAVFRVAVDLGAESVLDLATAGPWLVELLTDVVDPPSAGTVIGVVGGCGCAGATTLACALGVTAARSGRSVLLVDGDPLGGGLDLVFGAEADRGLRWADLSGTRGRVPAAALADALPRMAGLSVLSCDRGSASALPAEAMAAVLAAGRRAHDVVVVDLPRTTDEAARTVLGSAACVLLVVPAEVRAAAAASRVAAAVGLLCADLRVVVREPAPGRLDAGSLARALGLPLAGHLRAEPGLDADLERGEPPARRRRGPLAVLCGRLLDELLPVAGRAAA